MADNQSLAMLARMVGGQQALGALDTGYKNAQSRFDTNYYDPYTTFGDQSLGMLGNALGLNGAEGSKTATDAFQQGPGYQYQLDQGLNALNRTAASRGMLASGNNTQDLLKYSQGLADQGWNDWVTRLGGGVTTGLSAAQGQTGRQGTQAGIDMGYGTGAANVWNNLGEDLSGMITKQGQQQSGSGVLGGILGGLNLGMGVLSGNPFGVTNGLKDLAFGAFGNPIPKGNYF